jgi:hypothetical protein
MDRLALATQVYYSRRFMEKFIQAAGEEAVNENLNLAIDPQVDRIVSEAGTEAGLALRKHYLRS